MAARRATRTQEPGADALRDLERTVGLLVGQVALAMETLTVLRAEQMRMMERLGLQDEGHAPHRCGDPEHGHAADGAERARGSGRARRGRTGGRRG